MKKTTHKQFVLMLSMLTLILPSLALALGGGIGNPDLETPQVSLAKFRAFGYGAFIHWNPCSQTGLEVSFGRGSIGREKYDSLYKTFNPVNFDADEWVRMMKEVGFRYVVFVPKHCDGFCMWDTKTTDYNIMNSPFGRDVTKELSDACKKQDLAFCLYYSIADWYHPDYQPPGYQPFGGDYGSPGYPLPEGEKPDFERYVRYMKTHLKELSDICGTVPTWWFDANWSPNWTRKHGQELYVYMKKLQPEGLFSNRIGCAFNGGVYMPTWFASEKESAGDYAVLEVDEPRFNRDIPWEYTRAAQSTYSYNEGPVREVSQLKKWLIKSVCGDGNFILGISARPSGEFEPKLTDKLKSVGDWLKEYGESVYETRGGPYIWTQWYGSTCRDNIVYLHIFKMDDGTLVLPPLGEKIIRSSRLGGGKVGVKQTDDEVTITMDPNDLEPLDTIVALELNGNAVGIDPIEERSLTQGAKVSASNSQTGHGPEMASDGDMTTWWKAGANEKQGWIEYDLGEERTFSRAIIFEGKEPAQYNRLRHVQIQVKADGEWKTVAEAVAGGGWTLCVTNQEIEIPPTRARCVRLNIVNATASPVVHEFKLYKR